MHLSLEQRQRVALTRSFPRKHFDLPRELLHLRGSNRGCGVFECSSVLLG